MVKHRLVGRSFLIGSCLVLAACATSRGGNIPYNVDNFRAPDPPKVAAVDDTYKLAPLDTVTVTVFQVPDLSHDYVVDQSGRITMPLLGRVNAVGVSTNELGATIAKRLNEKYLRDPNVTVVLKDSASRVVTVDGSVNQPGIFPATIELSLVQVIALAHGTDQYANPHRVAIFRTIDGQRKAAAFDLISIRRGKMKDPVVYPGDKIIVDGSALKKTEHEVLQALPLAAIFLAI